MANKVLKALAPRFNKLLRIQPGAFGRARRATKASPANLRAAARLAAIHEANQKRLKKVPMEAPASRQVLRAMERRQRKQVLSTAKANAKGPGGAAAVRLTA
jgi:hypothetical protein